jgi:hypothetical protein
LFPNAVAGTSEGRFGRYRHHRRRNATIAIEKIEANGVSDPKAAVRAIAECIEISL